MQQFTFEELYLENEKKALGLQYTIAERERLKLLFFLMGKVMETNKNARSKSKSFPYLSKKIEIDYHNIINALMNSQSERYQDIFALLLNNGKKNGFFVEFGACDGFSMNNTYYLEKYFQWDGILAEPDKRWGDKIFENRTAKVDTRCVSSTTGDKIQFFESSRKGNSSTHNDHQYIGQIMGSYDVETITLLDLLKYYNAPKYIDFISIDTEGTEKEILDNFDFDQFKFGFICVEQHEELDSKDSIQPLLESAGYTNIFPREKGRPVPMQITGIDQFYVPNEHPALKW